MWFKAKREKSELHERLEKLEREYQGLRLEWESAYDKLVRIVQRFTKRAEQIEQSEPPSAGESATPGGSPTVMLDPISKRILEKRARYFPSRVADKEKTG